MTQEKLICLILVGAGLLLALLGFFLRKAAIKKIAAAENPDKKLRRKKTLPTVLMVVGSWLAVLEALTFFFGKKQAEEFKVELFAPRMTLFGMDISSTVVLTWIAMAVILVIAVLLRIFVIPRMREKPHGLQNVLEIAVDAVCNYTESRAPGMGANLPAYLFSLAFMMIVCSSVEFFGLRAPTADITMTFAMALITFLLINYYGIKKKGLGGRIKSMAQPTPIIFPIKIVSDVAVPVSMACRLFGNMLGGMIVMELLYYAMGSAALYIPSLVGLYFNVFHPCIQVFIFVTLTLSFINEATE